MIMITTPDGTITAHAIDYAAFNRALARMQIPGAVLKGADPFDGIVEIRVDLAPNIDTGTPADAGARDEAHADGTKWDNYDGDAVPEPLTVEAMRAVIADGRKPRPSKPARKPRAVTDADAIIADDMRRLISGYAARSWSMADLRREVTYSDRDIRAAMEAIGAVRTGKARGTRYSLPPQAPEAGAQDANGAA